MELTNRTPFPAQLFRTIIDDTRFAAAAFARVTYDLTDQGAVISTEQPWKVSGPPWQCDYGMMDSDEVFYKEGVDLFLFGSARAPGGNPATRVDVSIEVGAGFHRRLVVFGDRVWQRRGEQLIPSAPRPFTSIPLSMAHCFGGTDTWDELETGFPDNPAGKGFYIEEPNAEGRPLPNIEDPDHLIARWDDRPDPAGVTLCPMYSGPRIRNGIEFDVRGGIAKICPTLFNSAFPSMIVPRVAPGDAIRISGVSETGPITLRIPATRLMFRLQFDEEIIERPLAIDQVGIEVDRRRIFVAYRYPFRYVMYPLQRRSADLFMRD